MKRVWDTRCGDRTVGTVTAFLVAAFLVVGTRPVCAQQIDQVTLAIKGTASVNEVGTAHMQMALTFSPPRAYDRIKRAYPNLYVLFRDFGNQRAGSEVETDSLKITSDDGKRSISFIADALGYAVCKKNRWEIKLANGEDVVTQDANKVFTTMVMTPQVGLTITGAMSYLLPNNAQNVHVDKDHRLLTFTTPHQKPGAGGEPTVDVNVRCKKRMMAAVYKIYADAEAKDGAYWIAKTVFKNTGTTPVYDLRVYYKLGEYADMSVPERYSRVMPGGAVVDLYYPVVSAKVTELKNKAPAQLYVKYEYKDAAGKTYSEEEAHRLDFLGVNQFEFSNLNDEDRTDSWSDAFNNAALLAAFVTRMDDAVKMFAGYVSEAAGGVAAASRDEDALKWLQAAYEMELVNNIVYQTPSGFMTPDRSAGQDIKYPRDVFRDKSGTCVDLAITYASLAQSVGLDSYLMLIPGHCFAVIKLPGGGILPVENTGLGGGDKRMSFEQAVKTAQKELQESFQNGVFYLIDVKKELTEGRVPNPELPPVGADFLDKAGIRRLADLGGRAAPPAVPGGAPAPGGAPPAAPMGGIGIKIDEVPPALRQAINLPEGGALVVGTIPGAPADAAGLKKGDVITAIAAQPVPSAIAAIGFLSGLKPGQALAFTARRGAQQISANVSVVPLAQAMGFNGRWVGLFSQAQMVLMLEQDGYSASGKMMVMGQLPVNEEITAQLGQDNSFTVKKKTTVNGTPITIELSGLRNGDSMTGTWRVRGRGLLGFGAGDSSGNWTVYRNMQ